jgi:hypothetical protein
MLPTVEAIPVVGIVPTVGAIPTVGMMIGVPLIGNTADDAWDRVAATEATGKVFGSSSGVVRPTVGLTKSNASI